MKKTARAKTPNQKIDKIEIMEFALAACQYIESWNTERENELPRPDLRLQGFSRPSRYKIVPSIKTLYHSRLATKIKTYLINDKRIKEEDRISISTYHAYLSDIRRYLRTETKLVHHDLRNTVIKLQKQYSDHKDLLQGFLDADALTIGLVKSNALKSLLKIKSDDASTLYQEVHAMPVNHVLVDSLVKDAMQTAQRNSNIDKNLQKRKQHAKTISYTAVYNAIDKLLMSNSYADLAIGIALATGRRAIEVLLTGTFKSTTSKNKIMFSGQAKKGHGVEVKPYKIPTIIDAKVIINAVDTLRQNKVLNKHIAVAKEATFKSTNKALNSRVAGVLNRRIKKLFDDETMVFKDTRVIAVNIAIARIFPGPEYKNMDVNVFVKQYAGHDDDEEFKNYQHIKIGSDQGGKVEALHVQDCKPETVDQSSLDTLVKTLRGIVWQSGRMSTYTKIIDGLESKQANKPFKITQTAIIKGKISSGRAGITKFLQNNEAKKALAEFHKANGL